MMESFPVRARLLNNPCAGGMIGDVASGEYAHGHGR